MKQIEVSIMGQTYVLACRLVRGFNLSDDEVAMVMGHEMAHAVARHGSQRLLRTTLAQTIMTGAQFSFSDMDLNQRRAIIGALTGPASRSWKTVAASTTAPMTSIDTE